MKSFIAFALILAVAAAVPVSLDSKDAVVLKYENDNIGVDGFKYSFETSDGFNKEEQAQLKNVGTENEALEIRGQYSYTGVDGVVYTVTYIANENGFQPQGAHLPQSP